MILKKKLVTAAVLFCAFALRLSAQVEVPPPEKIDAWLQGFKTIKAPAFTEHVKRTAKKSDQQKINAYRVSCDFADAPAGTKFLHYDVPAMSETQYLPDAYPMDGCAGKPVGIVSALGEYEPGSFILYPLEDLGKVMFDVSDLKSADGAVFPKAELDLKTVKVWYQAGTSWYSYFCDDKLKLCPELLLNDEDLIKVDTQKVGNYARLTEKDGSVNYLWLSAPHNVDTRMEDTGNRWGIYESFLCMKDNFQDADKHCGATLNEGEFKQFFLTANVKKGTKPGLYKGAIRLLQNGKAIGSVPVSLRVLPFTLPDKPMTYFDINREFITDFAEYNGIDYIRLMNGNDEKLAHKQMLAILKNYARHNYPMPNTRDGFNILHLYREAGLDLSYMYTGSMLFGSTAEMKYDARRKKEEHIRLFGHNRYYLTWGDEFGLSTIKQIRPMVKIYKDAGFLFFCNSRHSYNAAIYFVDLFTPPIWPDSTSAKTAEKYNFASQDGRFGWYAVHHVGVENPAFVRRQYGLGPYRAGHAINSNYAHHLGGYNDLGGFFRSMNLYYATHNGVIDTIHWEAFREAIDDIRYATLIQQLARKAIDSGHYPAIVCGRKALQLLADMDRDNFDITTIRMEMIRHIMALRKFSK